MRDSLRQSKTEAGYRCGFRAEEFGAIPSAALSFYCSNQAQSTVPRKGPRQLRETIARWLGRQAVQDRLLQIAEARRTVSPLHRPYSSVRMWFLRRDVQQPPSRQVEGAAFSFSTSERVRVRPPEPKSTLFVVSRYHARRAWFVAGFPFLVL